MCVLCQEQTNEPLQCPAYSKRNDVGAGYKSLTNSINLFKAIDAIPSFFDPETINDGSGIENTLVKHEASWHKSCRNKFNNTEFKRAQKRKMNEEKEQQHSPVKARRSSTPSTKSTSNQVRCFFCEKIDKISALQAASTTGIDTRVRECALELQDGKLLAKLAAGDMVALEAKYHINCLVALYNRRRQNTTSKSKQPKDKLQGLAFAELVSYIDEFFEDTNANVPVLKLADLVKLYSTKLQELGVDASRVNSTRLKDRILQAFPSMSAHSQGRDILLVLDRTIGEAIKDVNKQDDVDGMYLAKAAKIVRNEILNQPQSFNGTFSPDCEDSSIPPSLRALICMILKGPGTIIRQIDLEEVNPSQASRTISQLIVYNTTVRQSKALACSSRHNRKRESPLPIYVGLKIHGLTRGRNLIDTLFNLGLCISYDRVLGISTDVANAVCDRFERDGVVCPPVLRNGLFTTAGYDNIDHNPSSTTSRDSFHGTAISLIQHPTNDNLGTIREINVIDGSRRQDRKITSLPLQFTEVQPLVLPEGDVFASPVTGEMDADCGMEPRGYENDKQWLNNISALYEKENLDAKDNLSWAAFHASKQPPTQHEPAVTSLMPMFQESAHSAPMVLHGMNIVKSAVQLVNPEQVPVIAMDQPLFALAKQIQWKWPHTHGENKFVIMFGGLHIELASLRALGKWLDKSGWTVVLTNADIASPGVVDSFVSASHITRTRRAHQITCAALHILQQRAYQMYIDTTDENPPLPFPHWKDKLSGKSPNFLYWSRVIQLQLLCLQLVKAFRVGDFKLYVESLIKLMPWMFALDQTNYSRWLPVHIRDMQELQSKHPEVYEKFVEGLFVVHKSRKPFSSMALDQAHEQENAIVKGEGGAVGLTDNESALKRWMVSGPEIARIVQEFETSATTSNDQNLKHHEQTYSQQMAFKNDLQSVISSFEDLGNPFMEDDEELVALDTKDVMSDEVVQTVKNVINIGQEQYKSYVDTRLIKRSTAITTPLKKNNLRLFGSQEKDQPKHKTKLAELKNDCALFSRLYIACQSRDGNLEDFFRHENQPWPPSIADMGELRKGQKADLVKCLEGYVNTLQAQSPEVEVLVIDGAVVVQMLSPGTARTFQEYSDSVFKPFILKRLQDVKRIDIIWDVYRDDSIKKCARERRGKGARRQVKPSTPIPKNWHSFLRVDQNKEELFHLLSEQLIHTDEAVLVDKEIRSTHEESVLSYGSDGQLSNIMPCTHEEADTRILLHVHDASLCGYTRIMIRTIDTDVVVLALSIFPWIAADELWVAFGVGKHFRYLPIHDIATKLGIDRCKALPLFHAMTGCDTGNHYCTFYTFVLM